MGRLSDQKLTTAYMNGSDTFAWDPKYGDQQGWSTNIGQFVSNQAFVSRPLCCCLLEAPRIFRYIPDGHKYIETLKAIIEVHALTITGFNEQLNVEFDQRAVGGAGAQQHEVVNVTREQPTPTFSFVEKLGRPIQHFLDFWIRYLLMDPEAKFALAAILNNPEITDLGADMVSMTVLFYEPTIDLKGVSHAWLCTNMMPHTTGDQSSQRDLQSSQQIRDLEIEFTALAQVGPGVKRMASDIMKSINTIRADPYYSKAAVDGIDEYVKGSGDTTYRNSVERAGRDAVLDIRGNGR